MPHGFLFSLGHLFFSATGMLPCQRLGTMLAER